MNKLKEAWAWVCDVAAPAVAGTYGKYELVRHAVTFAVGAFVGFAVL